MKQYALFGCGHFGLVALQLLGQDKISYFLDNNPARQGTEVEGVSVFSLAEKRRDLKDKQVVITVSERYTGEIVVQLADAGIADIITWPTFYRQFLQERSKGSQDHLETYRRAIDWVQTNTLSSGGITTTLTVRKGYPEVSGYFIPTLLRWGYRDLAVSYARWLLSIQHEEGCWYDTQDKKPYVFDTGQVLKGLVAIHEILPEVLPALHKGCDWLVNQIDKDGRLSPCDPKEFELVTKEVEERIHLYCLSPLLDAAKIFQEPRYEAAVKKCLAWYVEHQREEILDFRLLSHFHGYVMEALLDLGELDLAREGMRRLAPYLAEIGAVPAFHDVHWVCSTGLLQLALVWFRLGDAKHGNQAFSYACKLQNNSGGWFGSYPSLDYLEEKNTYFPTDEIPWAVKYFLDALAAKNKLEFEEMSGSFLDDIRRDDGLYQTVRDVVEQQAKQAGNRRIRVLDVGCGKGRYLKKLVEDVPQADYFAVDLSRPVMEYIGLPQVEKKQGALTQIPYEDRAFDVVYACESLEHAVDIPSGVQEMCRVARKGGSVVVIDKNDNHLGEVLIESWEQWFGEEDLKELLLRDCDDVEVRHGVPYHGGKIQDLFSAWIGHRE